MKRLTFFFGGLLTVLSAASFAQGGPASTGEIIVKFKPGVSGALKGQVLSSMTVKRTENVLGYWLVEPGVSESSAQLESRLDRNIYVENASPNYVLNAVDTPNDALYGQQWHLPRVSAPLAWNLQKGLPTTKIAILDTGVDTSHPDLAAKLLPGKDFINNDNDPNDDHGHGTHCAGIAAAITNNSIGTAGLGRNCSILPGKVLAGNGSGSFDAMDQAIIWAADQGAKVVSLSLGAPGADLPSSQAAVNYAIGKGTIVIAAAGNNGNQIKFYPAALQNVVAVASSDPNDTRSGFSNFGDWVHVAAPGSGIMSTTKGGGYGFNSGTSMACPVVAGLAGLVFTQAGLSTSPVAIRNYIQNNCDPVVGGQYVIHGRINAFKALSAVPVTGTNIYGPSALTVLYGTIRSGNLSSLQTANDGNMLSIDSSVVRSTMQYVGSEMTFTASGFNSSKLQGMNVTFDVSTSGNPAAGYVQALNVSTGQWVQLASFTSRQAPSNVKVVFPGTGTAFVNGSKEVKVRVLLQVQTTRSGVAGVKFLAKTDAALLNLNQTL